MKFIYELVTQDYASEDVRSLADELQRRQGELERGTGEQGAENELERGVFDLPEQDQS